MAARVEGTRKGRKWQRTRVLVGAVAIAALALALIEVPPRLGHPTRCGVRLSVHATVASFVGRAGAATSARDIWIVGATEPTVVSTWGDDEKPRIYHWNGRVLAEVPFSRSFVPTGVAALGARDVWVVGPSQPPPVLSPGTGTETQRLPMAMHWDGRTWSTALVRVPPHVSEASLTSVSGVSPNDVWATGEYDQRFGAKKLRRAWGPYPLLVHWDGVRWSLVSGLPHDRHTLVYMKRIVALSPTDVWAVGDRTQAPGWVSHAIHWNGSSWRLHSTPNVIGPGENDLMALTRAPEGSVWAVGFEGDRGFRGGPTYPLIERWEGGAWSVTPAASVPISQSTILNGVAAPSASEVWAVGTGTNRGTVSLPRPVVQRWDGRGWAACEVNGLGSGGLQEALSLGGRVWVLGTRQQGAIRSAFLAELQV